MLIAVWETALVLAAGLAAAEGLLCARGLSWWSSEKSSCVDCTRCQPPLLVLRPCAPHQDSVCATLNDLQLDWSWLKKPKAHPRRKHHDKKRVDDYEDQPKQAEGSGLPDQDLIDDDDEDNERSGSARSPVDLQEPYFDYEENVADDRRKYVVPVNTGGWDTMDWETTVLALTIAISMLFVVLLCVFSVYYSGQWRLLKKELKDDVEGLSTSISLMMASVEAQESMSGSGPENQYSNLRCAYLEQLLVGKGKDRAPGPGNVYIQENNNY